MSKREKSITSKIMSAIKAKNTKPEIILGKELWKLGLRYRKHYKMIGIPDFVFKRTKIAVFCDGDFWHGNNWQIRGMRSIEEELSGYSDFWVNKIKTNMTRDSKINAELKKNGWCILRFWESDIKKNSSKIASEIFETYSERRKIFNL